MTCNCSCTCPPQVGDRIQFKPYDKDGFAPGVRLNDALDLTLEYLGSEYVIYTWRARVDHPNAASGEACISREDFDEKIERVPGQ